MSSNNILKILCSLPSILLFLYFIPFVGVCLIILRCFVYNNKKRFVSKGLIIIGILIYIPKILGDILNLIKFKIDTIPYFSEVINSDAYIKLVDYSEFILTVGIITLIISVIFKKVFDKISRVARSYIKSNISQQQEISKQNDLEVKLRREKAKNTHVVYCPHCGGDNMLTEKVGKCKYCRRKIEFKEQ